MVARARHPDAVEAHSYARHNGGIATKRAYGSATITSFYVFRVRDADDPSKWMKIDGKGRTPGDRKTDAIRKSGLDPSRTIAPIAPTPAPHYEPPPRETDPRKVYLMKLAADNEKMGWSMVNSMSGADKAESELYYGSSRVYAAIARGADQEEAIATEDRRWRAYAAENQARIDSASKIRRGPSSGQSSIGYRFVAADKFSDHAHHLRRMIAAAPVSSTLMANDGSNETRGRGRPVSYRCRACGRDHARRPARCAGCGGR